MTMNNKLPKSLSYLEIIGLGVAGHLGWIAVSASIQEALGTNSILVWIPISIVSVIFVLQVKALASYYDKDSGGTPIYGTRLFAKYPIVGKYLAYGYYSAWVTAPTLYSLILVDLLKSNLDVVGIDFPTLPIRILFTVLAYIIGLSGFKALSVLHSLLAIPTIILLIDYVIEGIIPALAIPIVFTTDITFIQWCKYYFLATYTIYFCETVSVFIPEANNKKAALKFFNYAAFLVPIIFIGASFVMLQLNKVTTTNLYDNLYASSIFWNGSRAIYSSILVVGASLVSCGTAVALSSRILYQLSIDEQIPKQFSYLSATNSIPYSTSTGLFLAIGALFFTNVEDVVIITATSSIISVYSIQLGIWLNNIPNTFRFLSMPLFLTQLCIFFVGGYAWGLDKFLFGLAFPYFFYISIYLFSKIKFYKLEFINNLYKNKDPLALQLLILIIILISTILVTWNTRGILNEVSKDSLDVILVVFITTILFIAIGFACWTSFSQISYLSNAKNNIELLVIKRTKTLTETLKELEESNRLKDAFVETVSHELRTPLTNMRMALQMVKISLSRIESNTSLDNYVNILTKECDKEIALVNDLLDLQALEQGNKQSGLEYIGLHNLMADIIESFSEKMIKAKQLLKINLPERDIILYTNLIDLKRVITELLNNAHKYTPPNHDILINIKQKEGLIKLEVMNYGVIIPKVEQDKIFDKFYRIDKTDKHKGGGTGLGLSLIKELVKHLKGSIELIPDDTCTKFILTLPLNRNDVN